MVIKERKETLPIQFGNQVSLFVSGNYLDWFLPVDFIANRAGGWYMAVGAVSDETLATIKDEHNCANNTDALKEENLLWEFDTGYYEFVSFTSGCYYLGKEDVWRADGMGVINVTSDLSACHTNHLTSFATGFFPEVNTIDFDFVFAHASFEDNLTIYLCMIIVFILFLIAMIWAIWRDIKDKRNVKPPIKFVLSTFFLSDKIIFFFQIVAPFMKDNDKKDTYFYEILVETGPLESHSTTSKVEFILTGDDDETDVRCFSDEDRTLFRKGALDPFLMSTQYPLGDLRYLRIWHDNSGLSDSGAWYLMSVVVYDVQTGITTRFHADQWLAIDRGDYEDDITLHAVDKDEEADAYYIMKSGGNRKLTDDHIWFSVFTRPIRSRFNRKERVCICMSMLMLSMLANAMFYGTLPGRISDGLFKLGFLSFDPIDVRS